MMSPRSSRISLIATVMVLSVLCMSPIVSAQEGTPEAIVPRPDDCEVEPREVPLFAEIAATPIPTAPEPTPAASPLPEGVPADDVEVEAISGTVVESIACRNAGDLLRAYALMSDRMLIWLFGDEDLIPGEVQALLDDRQRVSKPERLAVISVSDVTMLPDGRVSAVVVTENPDHVFRDQLVFVDNGERWVIDEVVAEQVTPRP